MSASSPQITVVLKSAAVGDSQAAADVLALVYEELRILARAWLHTRLQGQAS